MTTFFTVIASVFKPFFLRTEDTPSENQSSVDSLPLTLKAKTALRQANILLAHEDEKIISENTSIFNDIIQSLMVAKLLKQQNWVLITESGYHLENIAYVLKITSGSHDIFSSAILNQERLSTLFDSHHSWFFTDEAKFSFWAIIERYCPLKIKVWENLVKPEDSESQRARIEEYMTIIIRHYEECERDERVFSDIGKGALKLLFNKNIETPSIDRESDTSDSSVAYARSL